MAGKGKSMFKRIAGWIHLWLGLVTGLIVVVIAVTGCLFVFQQEISDLRYRNVIFIPAQEKEAKPLPLARLQEIAQARLGAQQPVNDITAWKDPGRAWEFMAYRFNDTALTYFGAVEYYRSVFVNPYNGQVTGVRDYKTDFFSIVKYLHWSLLLNTKYGQPIVGWSTVIFVLMLITGLVLWWPKKWNRATRKASFSIRWKGRFKRLNYDLHNVLGFYFYIPALILALTGMVYAFQWFESFVYAAASGTTVYPQQPVLKSQDSAAAAIDPLTVSYREALVNHPQYVRMNISPASGQEGTISVYAYNDAETYYAYQEMQFDRYSGRLIRQRDWKEQNPGEKLIGMNYDIHVGAIGGLAGKIIAFFASLVAASLPITGFYVWWNKKRKRPHIPYRPEGLLLRKPVAQEPVGEGSQ
jgi:uncharacterized iron-regulated membrane protein